MDIYENYSLANLENETLLLIRDIAVGTAQSKPEFLSHTQAEAEYLSDRLAHPTD